MDEISVLIGGRAGEGLNRAGLIIARLLSACGYHVYMYYDYPSLIRGGHNFSIIRGGDHPVGAHRDEVDMLLALNQETLELHRWRMKKDGVIIYDSDMAKGEGTGIPLGKMQKEEGAPPIARNSALVGAFAGAAGIPWETVEGVITREFAKGADTNLRMARRGYSSVERRLALKRLAAGKRPLLSGNEAIGLGLLQGGLTTYIAYPMTPTSSLLHFLAGLEEEFGLKVIHPENEIAVMLMAIGAACGGERVAVGTSGGGFCLMTEGLGFAGMAEVPVVIVLGQRTGPSTGLPTYTSQGDLLFARYAGQGEFPRFIVAPGNADEAIHWAAVALRIAWRYQIPAFVLTDKTLSEGYYTLQNEPDPTTPNEWPPIEWDGSAPYRRYRFSADGISPFARISTKGAIVKVNSYYHDEDGITTEDPALVSSMQEKLMRKEHTLAEELSNYQTVTTHGTGQDLAFVCWGSNWPLCREVAEAFGARVVRPVVLHPFPEHRFREALGKPERTILVEQNATAQLGQMITSLGIHIDATVLRYDGRPFSLEELTVRIAEVLA